TTSDLEVPREVPAAALETVDAETSHEPEAPSVAPSTANTEADAPPVLAEADELAAPGASMAEPIAIDLPEKNPESELSLDLLAPSETELSIEPDTVAAAPSRDISEDEACARDQEPFLRAAPREVSTTETIAASDLEIPYDAPAAALGTSDAETSHQPEVPSVAPSTGNAATDDATIPTEAAEQEVDAPLPAPVEPEEANFERQPETPAATTGALERTSADIAALAADAAVEAPASTDLAPTINAPVEEPASAHAQPVAAQAAASIDPEKAARQALTEDLADIIQDVLTTTRFATKTMKPGRYSHAQMVLDAEPTDLASEFTPDALPHPAAIRSRLGRMERFLAFVSVGMIIAAGYCAFSIWGGGGTVAAPVIATPASAPTSGGERTRGMTRELGTAAVVIVTPETPGMAPQAGSRPALSQARRYTPRATQ
ncbi:MAG: hypothetical protein ACREFI_07100, partial [Stellaceae bacterium]